TGLRAARVGDHMRAAPRRDAGETPLGAAQAMVRESSDTVVVTAAEGLRARTRRPVGLVTQTQLLAELGRSVVDKAPMKILRGYRDLGFNVPVSPCQRNCPV